MQLELQNRSGFTELYRIYTQNRYVYIRPLHPVITTHISEMVNMYLYLGGAMLESRPGYWLCSLTFLLVHLNPSMMAAQ